MADPTPEPEHPPLAGESAPQPEPTPPTASEPAASEPAVSEPPPPTSAESSWAVAWRQLRKNRLAMISAVVLWFMAGVAVFAPLLANGRPLYLSLHFTHFYETDVVAFLDWHERFLDTAREIPSELQAQPRAALLKRADRYAAPRGLPQILERIGARLDGVQTEEFERLRTDYTEALQAAHTALTAEQYDLESLGEPLETLEEVGGQLRSDFCGLSLIAAYKLAAFPLLEAETVLADLPFADSAEAVQEERARLEGLLDHSQAGLTDMLRYLPPAEREQVADAVAEALADLTPLTESRDATAPSYEVVEAGLERLAELSVVLDDASRAQVPPDLQRLPPVTQFPALRYLSAPEFGFMLLFVSLTAGFLGRGLLRGRRPRAIVAILCAPALVGAGVWALSVDDALPPSEGLYKSLARDLEAAGAQAGQVVFPPVPFGENENIYKDRSAPPAYWERREFRAWEANTLEALEARAQASPKPREGDAFPVAEAGVLQTKAGPIEVEPGQSVEWHENDWQLNLGLPVPSSVKRFAGDGETWLTPAEVRDRSQGLRAHRRTHVLGTDDNGRDILGRLILGARVSLSVGFVAVSIYVLIGVVLGALAGYFRGWIDIVISRFTEVVMCFPSFFLIIAVMSVIERPSIFHIMVVIGLTRWTEVFRLVRGEFLRLSEQDFVVAGRALGLPTWRVVFRHILPNAMGPVFVAAAFGVAGAILIESALSFLGFGVPQPQASWGSVLHDARGNEQTLWWVTVFPGVLIFLTITCYNLLGEGLRDALDPRLRH